jgi:outer membrane protein insertion porin family
VGVSVQSGRYSDQYDLSYFIPWFLDRPQSVGVQVYDSKVDYTQLVNYENSQQSQGVTLTYGRSFGFFSSVSVSYSLFDREDKVSFVDLAGQLVPITYEISNSSIRPAYAFESRDSRLEPTSGKRISASVEFAGGPLGGNNNFVRPEAGISYFRPLTVTPFKSVAAFNVETGWVEPIQGYELVPLERYFMGGETSIRGFEFRDLTVRCEGGEPYPGRPLQPCRPDERLIDENGSLLGGNSFLQLNVEYHLLVGGPFRIVAFADAAQVYGEDQSFDLGRLRQSAGIELRVFVPVFGAPLRFIYSSNLDPLPDDEFESFQFSIGVTF